MSYRVFYCIAWFALSQVARGQHHFEPLHPLADPAGNRNDVFGGAVMIDGDYLAIGAPRADGTIQRSGAVFVYRRQGFAWHLEQVLTAADASPAAGFGSSLALVNQTLAVGAHFDGQLGANAGAAYLFRRESGTWIQTQKLFGSDTKGFDGFGWGLTVHRGQLVVGSGGAAETVYVFEPHADHWVEVQRLVASSGPFLVGFGLGRGVHENWLLVGAPYHPGAATLSGTVFAFQRTPAGWQEEQILYAGDGQRGDEFGSTIAMAGTTAWIGAIRRSGPAGQTGAVYVYQLVDGVWQEHEMLQPPSAGDQDLFGWTLDVQGDLLAIGAPGHDGSHGVDTGAVFLYGRRGGSTGLFHVLQGPAGDGSTGFGSSLDLDGPWLMAGAGTGDGREVNSGTAHPFLR